MFDYEAKVRFRNEEREKYRKMLHAEYAKLSQVLNEGVVKFNQRVRGVTCRPVLQADDDDKWLEQADYIYQNFASRRAILTRRTLETYTYYSDHH